MKFDIKLPKAADWNSAEQYAENLRETTVAGITACVPVGEPKIILNSAGNLVESLPGGNILSINNEDKSVTYNGAYAGALKALAKAILPQGNDEAMIFTEAGVEYFIGGKVQSDKPTEACVNLHFIESDESVSSPIIMPSLSASYPRADGPLADVDAKGVSQAVSQAIGEADRRAEAAGLWTQPIWVAWRMLDAKNRIVLNSQPQLFGSLQGNVPISLNATHDGSTFAITDSASFVAKMYGLELIVKPFSSEFWQNHVAAIEIVVWESKPQVISATGAFALVDSAHSSLVITPTLLDPDFSATEPVLLSRIEFPFRDGGNFSIRRGEGSRTQWVKSVVERDSICPSAVCTAGSIVAYGLADQPGVIAVAPCDDPLNICAIQRVCVSKILRITTPTGSQGGWNYARHHLLAFGIDGIYSVSVSGALTSITASRISMLGIERPDAVATSTKGVYVASIAGTLHRIKGSRIETLKVPLAPKALCYNEPLGELWVAPEVGNPWVLNESSGVSLRTDVSVSHFIEPSMAVDTLGRLRNLAIEDFSTETFVKWRCREICEVRYPLRRALWVLDSQRASELSLQLLCDSGGSPQRLIELTANGPINAPISAMFKSPRRAFYSVCISGYMRHPSRLLQVLLDE